MSHDIGISWAPEESGEQEKEREDYFIVRPPVHNNRVNIHTISIIIDSLRCLNCFLMVRALYRERWTISG